MIIDIFYEHKEEGNKTVYALIISGKCVCNCKIVAEVINKSLFV